MAAFGSDFTIEPYNDIGDRIGSRNVQWQSRRKAAIRLPDCIYPNGSSRDSARVVTQAEVFEARNKNR